ncbi:MAG: PLP-dependent transferase [Chelatococcus sp.]|uniref:trans-sulfuration enzyme family protein n=1 Tax=Chelatococcus sp. TaxID=1953771 RepID=UPI0025B7F1A5|nr:aminotransferase class I/II-fold pyridoxal phosphate-dependent enzyme [Chelatococcus sp.]MBX3538521.1 PLP-dependent transferase [Chelatococcus sp.]
MRKLTRCVHQPAVSHEGFAALVPGVHRASTIVFASAQDYRDRKQRGPDGYSYGLNGTPTARVLEAQIAALEGAAHCTLMPSGMSAISLVMLAVLRQGDRVLIPDSVYPPVRKFCATMLAGLGIAHSIYRPDASDMPGLLGADVRLIWMESPGSTTMEVQDLRAIAALARAHGILTGCDNTWATPLLLRPLELGVDIAMQALTKYAGGHSDILMGSVAVNDPDLYLRLKEARTTLGISVSPDDCSLVLRGLASMGVRVAHAGRVALELAGHLRSFASVRRVLHPAFADCEGSATWAREATGHSATFTVQIEVPSLAVLDAAIEQARIFAIGASWGGAHSLMVPMTMDDTRNWPPVPGATYIRLSIGLEDPRDLRDDLDRVFGHLDAALAKAAAP